MRFSTVLAAAGFLLANSAYAFNFGNMMNPSKWGNDNDDDYYEDDYYGGPGPYGPPPGYYGAPGYGVPGYGAPGYGAPGYGAPGYGAPGYGGGYAAPNPVQSYGPDHNLPDTHSGYEYNRDKEEISRLKERIRKLEEARQPAYQAPRAYGSQQATPQTTTQPGWKNQRPYRYRQE